MKKISESILLFCLVLFSLAKSSGFKDRFTESKFIEIAGIVIDSESLTPLENAKLYDEKGKLISTTDNRGYFSGKVNYSEKGGIHFKIRAEHNGYFSFTQKENWANLGNVRCIYYFGLEKTSGKSMKNSFSEMKLNKDLTYESVLAGFESVKNNRSLYHKLALAGSNNENVFLMIDQKYYIMSNTGWLLITSPDDKVSVNKKKIIKASELNALIKRKDIKNMSPSESKDYSYEIYAK